jgi:hypothetical protein
MECTASLDTKVGTMLFMNSGQVDNCTDGTGTFFGLAAEEVTSATTGDPIKVEIIAPGMVIRGTSNADASSVTGFASQAQDIDAAQNMDMTNTDTTGGFLSVYRVNNSAGTEVDCVVTDFDMGPA